MFKSEKAAKYALTALMGFFALTLPFVYVRGSYADACLILGLELILMWGYLNPWILQERYSLFFPVDTSRMTHNVFLISGAIVLLVAGLMLLG
ncbi:MAG: hypothetical protein KDI19_00220 [Pseudomonadales bacterium]|nr:hypothetical protein [Pseudomonadales bacterium]